MRGEGRSWGFCLAGNVFEFIGNICWEIVVVRYFFHSGRLRENFYHPANFINNVSVYNVTAFTYKRTHTYNYMMY